MAVAWIGNREVSVEQAARRAAELLMQSRCPVFSLDGDVHTWRAAIALAEQVGGAYDHIDGAALAREVALFTDKGAMTVAPGEVRRRADCLVIVGDVPQERQGWLHDMAGAPPDLANGRRQIFRIPARPDQKSRDRLRLKSTILSTDGGAAATLAALRAKLLGRTVGSAMRNFTVFEKAQADAAYTAFIYSGESLDEPAMEMLQGLVADLNKKKRASTLLLPSSDDAWGGALTSTWMTGFAPRTGFGRGMPEYDPWRFDVSRMIEDGEADLHVVICARSGVKMNLKRKVQTVVLTRTEMPFPKAAVTIAIGEPAVDHDAVRYSSKVGTIVAVAGSKHGELPNAPKVIRDIVAGLPEGVKSPC